MCGRRGAGLADVALQPVTQSPAVWYADVATFGSADVDVPQSFCGAHPGTHRERHTATWHAHSAFTAAVWFTTSWHVATPA